MSSARTRWDARGGIMGMLSRNSQSSQVAVIHNPNPTTVESSTLSDSELLTSTSKHLRHFEELRNIKRVELTDKRIVAIREKIEKAMPRLQALTTGSPVPTPKAVSVREFAERCLSNFPDVDPPSLRLNADAVKNGSPKATRPPSAKPTPAPTPSKTTAAPPSMSNGLASGLTPPRLMTNAPGPSQGAPTATPSHHPPLVQNRSVQATPQMRAHAPDGERAADDVSRPPPSLQIAEGMYETSSRAAMNQKDLLTAVHDLVNSSSFQWTSNVSTYGDNDVLWKHPPCLLSPDEFQQLPHARKGVLAGGNGHGGMATAAPSMGNNLVPGTDLNGRMGSRPFGHEYMQSMPTGHDFTSNAHVYHRSLTDRGIGDGRKQKRRTSTESMVK